LRRIFSTVPITSPTDTDKAWPIHSKVVTSINIPVFTGGRLLMYLYHLTPTGPDTYTTYRYHQRCL